MAGARDADGHPTKTVKSGVGSSRPGKGHLSSPDGSCHNLSWLADITRAVSTGIGRDEKRSSNHPNLKGAGSPNQHEKASQGQTAPGNAVKQLSKCPSFCGSRTHQQPHETHIWDFLFTVLTGVSSSPTFLFLPPLSCSLSPLHSKDSYAVSSSTKLRWVRKNRPSFLKGSFWKDNILGCKPMLTWHRVCMSGVMFPWRSPWAVIRHRPGGQSPSHSETYRNCRGRHGFGRRPLA